MTPKKHFYAVLKGHRPGIYTTWGGPGGAEEQVKAYPGAVFKGFGSREEAEYYLRTGGKELMPSPPLFAGADKKQNSSNLAAGQAIDYQADLANGFTVLFTDGASTGNPGPGGYGVVLLHGTARKELSGGYHCTTNNRMELMACIRGLMEVKSTARVILYSDSSYVVNAVQKGWARRWRSNQWLRSPDRNGETHRAENVDLWIQLLDLLERIPVEFRWVKGHANQLENERCDQLAVRASKRKDLPEDSGFTGSC